MKKEQIKKLYLLLEFVLFFFGVPLFMLFGGEVMHPSSFLVPILVFIITILRFFTNFKWKELWAFEISWVQVRAHLAIAVVVSVLMIIFLFLFDRDNLFNLPRGNWKAWLILSTFYPIFSAYIQEVIFRTFMFRRYVKLFGSGMLVVWMSSITFSFAHIFYFHPVSIILTFLLGFYLAKLYQKTQSVLFVAFLHGIYGNMVFTIGLGHYFWVDMFKWI